MKASLNDVAAPVFFLLLLFFCFSVCTLRAMPRMFCALVCAATLMVCNIAPLTCCYFYFLVLCMKYSVCQNYG